MAYKHTTNHYIIGFLILIILVLFIGWMWFGWFASKSNKSTSVHNDGEKCVTIANKPGTYKNGVCTDAGGPPPGAETQRM